MRTAALIFPAEPTPAIGDPAEQAAPAEASPAQPASDVGSAS